MANNEISRYKVSRPVALPLDRLLSILGRIGRVGITHPEPVRSFLVDAFGEPNSSKGSLALDEADAMMHGWYSVRDIGAAIQYFDDDDQHQTGILIIRQQ